MRVERLAEDTAKEFKVLKVVLENDGAWVRKQELLGVGVKEAARGVET